MLIRKAKLKDVPELNKLRKESFVYHQKFDKEEFKYEIDAKFFRNAIYTHNKVILIAEDKNKILGFCYGLIKNKEGHLVNIFISEKSRGKGIGKILIKELLSEFKHKKIKCVYTTIWHSNMQSITLHKNLGFKPTHLWMKKRI